MKIAFVPDHKKEKLSVYQYQYINNFKIAFNFIKVYKITMVFILV